LAISADTGLNPGRRFLLFKGRTTVMNLGEQQKLLERLRKAVDDRHAYHMQGGQHRHDGDFAEELIKQFFNMTVEHSVPNLEAAAEDGIALGVQIANLEGQLVDEQRRSNGYASECRDVEQYLGQALGYPWYRDDPKNFPDCTDADGVCVGEHTPATIAAEGAKRIIEMRAKIAELDRVVAERDTLQLQFDDVANQRDRALEGQISIMDFDYPPVAQQGAPNHEVVDLLTANDVNAWIKRIEELTVANEGLNNQVNRITLDMNNAFAARERADETYKSLSDAANYQIGYRARRISTLENCIRWALRKLMDSRTEALVPTVADRANNMFNHLFPPPPSEGDFYDPNVNTDYARRNDTVDAMSYLVRTGRSSSNGRRR
jgi:hypothetical protein